MDASIAIQGETHPPGHSASDADPESEEYEHWCGVMRAMLQYDRLADTRLQRSLNHLNRLSELKRRYLPNETFRKLNYYEECVQANQYFFNSLVRFQDYKFGDRDPSAPLDFDVNIEAPQNQLHRDESVLHSLAREWSAHAQREREESFGPLIDQLTAHCPVRPDNLYQQRVLVPGSGTGRLPIEIAGRGFATQANEFSTYMLTASHFMLNGVDEVNAFDIYPWIDKYVHL
jgi:carnosine N-methyltransferase